MKISELPHFYKRVALKRQLNLMDRYRSLYGPDYIIQANSIDSFSWIATPEGDEFWRQIHVAYSYKDLPSYPADCIDSFTKFIILSIQHKI